MASESTLLIFVDPTQRLDILFRKRFYSNLLNEYFNEGRTIIITTHQVEEVEHILTDLVVIKNGRLVLNETMDAIQRRYCEVMARPGQIEQARALGPIHERVLFGRHIFRFDRHARASLAELGNTAPQRGRPVCGPDG